MPVDPTENYFEKEFSSIAGRTGFLVGRQEIEARQMMGDKAYEKMVTLIESQTALGLNLELVRIGHIVSVDKFIQSGAFLVKAFVVLAFCWSAFYWLYHG